MPRQWRHDIFGCFENPALSIITFVFPCYTFGKIAEAVGEDGLWNGIAFGITSMFCQGSCVTLGGLELVHFSSHGFGTSIQQLFHLLLTSKVRGKLRQQYNIEGTLEEDLLLLCCCEKCALVQMAQEIQNLDPGPQHVHRD